MKVRFKEEHVTSTHHYNRGDEVEFHDGEAKALIASGTAEPVEKAGAVEAEAGEADESESAEGYETAAIEQPERAARRRARPRTE